MLRLIWTKSGNHELNWTSEWVVGQDTTLDRCIEQIHCEYVQMNNQQDGTMDLIYMPDVFFRRYLSQATIICWGDLCKA